MGFGWAGLQRIIYSTVIVWDVLRWAELGLTAGGLGLAGLAWHGTPLLHYCAVLCFDELHCSELLMLQPQLK